MTLMYDADEFCRRADRYYDLTRQAYNRAVENPEVERYWISFGRLKAKYHHWSTRAWW